MGNMVLGYNLLYSNKLTELDTSFFSFSEKWR